MLNLLWTEKEVPGTTYGLSDSGWMDMEFFKQWFLKHFLYHAISSCPIILLLDGHSSHFNLDGINLAKENGVIMFMLVPHTTHAMQPLDTAVYRPLKTHRQDVCHEYLQENPGRVITKYQFNEMFSKAWLKALSPESIISGFKVCGVYPCVILDRFPDDSSCNKTASPKEQREYENTEVVESFTEEEERFERQYTNSFDIYDPKYIS